MTWRPSVLLVLVVLAVHCPAEEPALEQRLLLLAGKNAFDCGTVQNKQDPVPASECAKHAFSSKRAFVVRYHLGVSYDSDVMTAFAGTEDGTVFAIEYDSARWHQPKKPARVFDDRHNIVTKCPAPVYLRNTKSGRLTCFAFDPHSLFSL
jgi:hypothetical protein